MGIVNQVDGGPAAPSVSLQLLTAAGRKEKSAINNNTLQEKARCCCHEKHTCIRKQHVLKLEFQFE